MDFDAGWSTGNYGIGYDNSGLANGLFATMVSNTTVSLYTRTTFDLADAGAVQNLYIGIDYDDAFLFADFNVPSNIYALPLTVSRDGFDLVDKVAETQAELDAFLLATGFDRAIALEFGPDGDLYVMDWNEHGRLTRLTRLRD